MDGNENIKQNIIQFLKLCVNYTEGSLERKSSRLKNLNTSEAEIAKIEIEKWTIHKEFTEYTINELLKGDLDEWINHLHDSEFNPEPRS